MQCIPSLIEPILSIALWFVSISGATHRPPDGHVRGASPSFRPDIEGAQALVHSIKTFLPWKPPPIDLPSSLCRSIAHPSRYKHTYSIRRQPAAQDNSWPMKYYIQTHVHSLARLPDSSISNLMSLTSIIVVTLNTLFVLSKAPSSFLDWPSRLYYLADILAPVNGQTARSGPCTPLA